MKKNNKREPDDWVKAILVLKCAVNTGKIKENIATTLIKQALRRIKPSKKYVSVEASKVVSGRGLTERDHAVPIAVMADHILSKIQDESMVQGYIERNNAIVVVMKEEHRRLMKDQMPDDWKDGDCILKRYANANPKIEIMDPQIP